MKQKTLHALAALVALAFVFIIVVGVFGRSSVSFFPLSFFELARAPEDVKNMMFVTNAGDAEGISRIRWGGIETFVFPDKHFIQVTRAGSGFVALVALIEQTGSGAIDLYRVEKGTLTPLTKDGTPKTSIGASPDGSRIAYSVQGPALPETLEDGYDVRRFVTHVLDASGEELFLVPGNHPYFLDNDLLLVLNERGFEVLNLETGASDATRDDLAFLAVERPIYGAEAFIVKNPITSEYLVMRFASLEPVIPEYLGTLPASENVFFAVSEMGGRFEAQVSDGRLTLTRFNNVADTEGTAVLSLPSSVLAPLALIP